MRYGYARISTKNQNLENQVDLLEIANCDKIYSDVASGDSIKLKNLFKLLTQLNEGDEIVVVSIDRLSRVKKELESFVALFRKNKIRLTSLSETQEEMTDFIKFAEIERKRIKQRTKAGLIHAAKNGRKGGRPRVLLESEVKEIKEMMENPLYSASLIAKQYGISKATLYRTLQENKNASQTKV